MIWWQQDENGNVRNPYDLLMDSEEFKIGRGTEAMVAFARTLGGTLDSSELKRIRKNLLRYCELDTLAMLMIYEHWKKLLESGSGTYDTL